jgi:hypothetical protein
MSLSIMSSTVTPLQNTASRLPALKPPDSPAAIRIASAKAEGGRLSEANAPASISSDDMLKAARSSMLYASSGMPTQGTALSGGRLNLLIS